MERLHSQPTSSSTKNHIENWNTLQKQSDVVMGYRCVTTDQTDTIELLLEPTIKPYHQSLQGTSLALRQLLFVAHRIGTTLVKLHDSGQSYRGCLGSHVMLLFRHHKENSETDQDVLTKSPHVIKITLDAAESEQDTKLPVTPRSAQRMPLSAAFTFGYCTVLCSVQRDSHFLTHVVIWIL
jgi:hypothetical protein